MPSSPGVSLCVRHHFVHAFKTMLRDFDDKGFIEASSDWTNAGNFEMLKIFYLLYIQDLVE